jgi:membrane associated rhomboid family serine protease
MFLALPIQHEQADPKPGVPLANSCLIAANVILFVLSTMAGWNFGVGHGTGLIAILLYGFSHANFLHLAVNMWLLMILGNPVNRRLGNLYYTLAYLSTIVTLGVFGRIFLREPIVGASGAIFAVFAIALLLMPSARIKFVYIALFPVTLLIGWFKKPEHEIFWLIRYGVFYLRSLACLWIVPLVLLLSFVVSGWNWAHLGHLLGMVCGVAIVLVLPKRITMGSAAYELSG